MSIWDDSSDCEDYKPTRLSLEIMWGEKSDFDMCTSGKCDMKDCSYYNLMMTPEERDRTFKALSQKDK